MRACDMSTRAVEFYVIFLKFLDSCTAFPIFVCGRSNPTGLVGFAMARTYFDPKVTLEANFKHLRSHDDIE